MKFPFSHQPNPGSSTRGLKLIAWTIIVLFGGVLSALSIYYTVNNLGLLTDRGDLVSSDLRLIRLSDQLQKEFGSRDQLVVVVSNQDRRRSIAFAEELAKELEKYPQNFVELFYRVDPEAFRQWALLYLEPEEFQDLQEKLLDHRQQMTAMAADPQVMTFFQVVNEEITRSMISHLFTSFLEEEEDEERIPDLSLLNASLKQLYLQLAEGQKYRSVFKSLFPGDLGDFSEQGYFFTPNDKYLLFLVTPHANGFSAYAENLQLLREVLARVKKEFPDIEVGVTGPRALSDDEMTGALSDMTLATWLSLLFQFALLVIFFRSIKRPLVESLVLIIGLSWTFGAATLVVGHLNILSMIFAPLILGMTIDYGIHWFSHLEEEQGTRRSWSPQILKDNYRKVAVGIVVSAFASTVTLIPLVYTGFKGLAELGLILAVGIPIMALASLLLLPALMIVTEKHRANHGEPETLAQPRPFMSLRWHRPGVIVALGVVIVILGGLSLPHVPFDLNPLNLQNQETESVVWELKLLNESSYSSTYGTMLASCLDTLPAKVETLKKLPSVSQVESILSFLPEKPETKRPVLKELQPVVTAIDFPAKPASSNFSELAAIIGRIRFKLSQAKDSDWQPEHKPTQKQLDEANFYLEKLGPLLSQGVNPHLSARLAAFETGFFTDLKDKWDLIRANVANTKDPRIDDLPLSVRQRFISPHGNYLIRIFPSQHVWEPEPLGLFVKDLMTVDPDVVGEPVLLYHFNRAFRDACLWAAGMGSLAVFIVLVLVLRSFSLTILTLIPLVVGSAMTLCLMWLLNVPFNQANVLFLPLILGEGVEYGIFINVRWKMEKSAREITLPASTAKGVLLSALTTMFGFGILMISGHRGVFSLGLLAAIGALSVLVAALSVLPASLRLMENHKVATEPATRPFQGLKRWLQQLVNKEAP